MIDQRIQKPSRQASQVTNWPKLASQPAGPIIIIIIIMIMITILIIIILRMIIIMMILRIIIAILHIVVVIIIIMIIIIITIITIVIIVTVIRPASQPAPGTGHVFPVRACVPLNMVIRASSPRL